MAIKLPTIPTLQAPTAGGVPAANAFALATGKAPVANTPQTTAYTAPAAPLMSPVTVAAPVAPVTAISASKLTPQATPTYPTVQSNVAPQTSLAASLAAIQEQALGIQSQLQKQQQEQVTTAAAPVSQRGTVLDRILGLGNELGTKGDFALEVNKENDIAGKAQKVTDLTNQYKAKERAYDLEIRKIQNSNPQGTGAEVAAAQIADIQRNKNQELADIAIQQSAALGNYDTAREIAQQTVDAKYEGVEAQIQLLKDYYQLSANDLTESEKVQVQANIQEKQAAVEYERQKDLYAYKQEIDQQDPKYQAELANIYSQISARAAESVGNPNGTLNGKAQTTAQGLVQGYADRLAQSDVTINKIGANFTNPASSLAGVLPNFLKSADRQVYEQAQRNFVNAILRRESGAAIAPSEFQSAATQYFPQPGDKPAVVQQKAANRQTVINSLYNQANVAQPVLPGSVIDYDGKSYQVGDDGETLTEL